MPNRHDRRHPPTPGERLLERAFGPSEVREVDLTKVQGVEEFDEASRLFFIHVRIATNLADTGHPFHHLTASGVIVDSDPTLEYVIARLTDAKPAVPVNRTFYGFDPFDTTTAK